MRNYQRELDKIISENCIERKPTLLLHACCAPCSSYCLEYLSKHFDITVFYFNPNITVQDEYNLRLSELKRLISEMSECKGIDVIEGEYNPNAFLKRVEGMESDDEGGSRCSKCFTFRLEESVKMAKELNFEYVCTTLTISPHKNAEIINTVGESLTKKYGVNWLPGDFKKKNGYKRSIELSKQYNIYRQDFCGCVY